MLQNYEKLKTNLEKMSKNQMNMMRMQELRQKQHSLEMEEAKLSMLNASHNAVALVDSFQDSKDQGGGSQQNIESLKASIKKAKQNLSMEEQQLRGSIESIENEMN